ncbi:hypothetical protein SH139x_000175 [Planctomycetaceae bacterium SH139]
MRNLLILAALTATLFGAVRSADAGVMIAELPTPVIVIDDASAKAAKMAASPGEEHHRSSVDQNEPVGMSVNSGSGSQTLSQLAAFSENMYLLASPLPSSYFALVNAALPPNPLLDNLLKPS